MFLRSSSVDWASVVSSSILAMGSRISEMTSPSAVVSPLEAPTIGLLLGTPPSPTPLWVFTTHLKTGGSLA